jgi:hypothetical protein
MTKRKKEEYRSFVEKLAKDCASEEELFSELDRLQFRMTREERQQAPVIYSDSVVD